MSKQTGWYYTAQMGADELVAHHFSAPLERNEQHLSACGDVEAFGSDLRHGTILPTRCGLCEKLLEPESEVVVEAGLVEATEEAVAAHDEEVEV